MTFVVKDINGAVLTTIPSPDMFVSSAVVSSTHMANDTLTIACTSASGYEFPIGCYVELEDGSIYRMNQLPSKTISGKSVGYEYELVFESVKYDLLNVRFLLPEEALGDVITADMATLITYIVNNACRVYGEGSWEVGSIPVTDVISQQFTEQNCLQALQKMMTAWKKDFDINYEFRIERTDGKNVINVFEEDGGADSGLTLAYGHAGGLYSIRRTAVASENVVTRLFAYGSTENITVGYPHSRLCLPWSDPWQARNGSYVQDDDAIAMFGIKEGFATFDDIKPRALFRVDAVERIDNPLNRSGYNIRITSNDMAVGREFGFCPEALWEDTEDDYQEWLTMYGYNHIAQGSGAYQGSYTHAYYDGTVGGAATKVVGTKKYAANGTMKVTFNTGNCAGISFEVVEGSTIDGDGGMTLVTQNYLENVPGEYYIPSDGETDTWEIKEGDEFVISDILMPIALIRKAEVDLLAKANDELAHRRERNARYNIEFDQIAKDRMDLSALIPGNFIHIVDNALGIGAETAIKINRVDRDLMSGDVTADISTIKENRVPVSSGYSSGTPYASRADEEGTHRTTLTCQFIPNYDYTAQQPYLKPCNTLYVSEGTFSDYYLMDSDKVWRISERVIELQSGFKYDIFVQASKKTDYATITVRKNMSVEIDSLRKNTPGTATNDPIMRGLTNLVGSRDESSYYFKIGTISEERYVLADSDWAVLPTHNTNRGKTRTLELQYGYAVMSANDITSGTIGGNVLLGSRVFAEDSQGAEINVGDRIQRDRDNVVVLNEALSGIKDSLHSVITSIQSGHVVVGGQSINVDFNWSQCDDRKCQPVRNPEDLIPIIGGLK